MKTGTVIPNLFFEARKAGKPLPPAPNKKPACFDRKKEYTAAESAAMGLNAQKRWNRCTTGQHVAHGHCDGKPPKVIAKGVA